MAIEQLKVKEIVKQAVSKSVDIPEFQRDFIWSPEQVKLFTESLYRDYPVGSFLLWDSSEYHEAKTAKGEGSTLWIVDGQQRTTALCLLMGCKPYWWPNFKDWNKYLKRYDVMVNMMPEEDEYPEFALRNPFREKDPRWVSVRRILSAEKPEEFTKLAAEIAQKLAQSPEEMMEILGKLNAKFHEVWQIRERDIPVIKIDHEIEDVAEIFARLNQAGTRVKEADVVLALAAAQNPGWVREEYLPFCTELKERGWDLDAGIYIRTMTGIGCGRSRLKEVKKEFWCSENLEMVWKKTKTAITEVLKRLSEFGILNPDLLPSTNSLIPLFVIHHRWKEDKGYRFNRAFHWFLIANKDGRYTTSPTTSLNEDVRAIAESSCFIKALETLNGRLRSQPEIKDEEFLNRYDRAGNRFLRLMLYLILFNRGALDWVDRTRIGYDKAGDLALGGFKPQWHHIFPRSVLKRADYSDDDIHTLANITVLNEQTNVGKLSGKEPWRYISRYEISADLLKSHLIPESFICEIEEEGVLRQKWDVRNYTDFVIERAYLLAEETNRFLKKLLSLDDSG